MNIKKILIKLNNFFTIIDIPIIYVLSIINFLMIIAIVYMICLGCFNILLECICK
jgi:hypothetical protein